MASPPPHPTSADQTSTKPRHYCIAIYLDGRDGRNQPCGRRISASQALAGQGLCEGCAEEAAARAYRRRWYQRLLCGWGFHRPDPQFSGKSNGHPLQKCVRIDCDHVW